ncbi:MAG TPA: hypothetical protein VKH63_15795, partial [Candidatus Acidoferrum sp.]|nr:hypothetical protein [Candidatus Acidoferrum sp.]
MNMATPNIPTPIRTVSTTSLPAMAHCPPGPHGVSWERLQAAACRIVRFLPSENKARSFHQM